MTITETGDRLTFFCTSESVARRVYRVSLLDHGGLGECHCAAWRCHCWPLVKKGQRSYCKHVRFAREYFLDQLLAEMAKQETEPSCR